MSRSPDKAAILRSIKTNRIHAVRATLCDKAMCKTLDADFVVSALQNCNNLESLNLLLEQEHLLETLQAYDLYCIIRSSTAETARIILNNELCRTILTPDYIALLIKECRAPVVKEIVQFNTLRMAALSMYAAKKVQALYRGRKSRQHFGIKPLPQSALTNYHLMPLGNDPKDIECPSSPRHAGQIAVVATSGMRAVELACQIAQDFTKTPKIFLVDNSKNIHELWHRVQAVFTKLHRASDLNGSLIAKVYTCEAFQAQLDDHERSSGELSSFLDINKFFQDLFARYGFENIKKIILNTATIRGDWTDTETFTKIKHINSKLGIQRIYAYPSNIVACAGNRTDQHRVLKSIEALEPTATIHTDLCPYHSMPERSFVYEGSGERARVLTDLGLDRAARPTQITLGLSDIGLLMQYLSVATSQIPSAERTSGSGLFDNSGLSTPSTVSSYQASRESLSGDPSSLLCDSP